MRRKYTKLAASNFGLPNLLVDAPIKYVRQIYKVLIDFLVPPRCVNCNTLAARQSAICSICWNKVRFVERPFCEIMGTPFSVNMGESIISTEAIANPPPFGKLRSAVLYDDITRKLISRFKFSDRSDLAPFIANVMARAGSELLTHADIIIPLPLHWRRFHARRFNQSAILANLISVQYGIPFEPMILTRIKNTRQQIGLTTQARRQNMAGAFKVLAENRPLLAGKKILLIDDVYTSGASVKAATKTLLRAGTTSVDVLTFAKVHSGTI